MHSTDLQWRVEAVVKITHMLFPLEVPYSKYGYFSSLGSLWGFLCFIKVPYYTGDRKRDPNLENYPYGMRHSAPKPSSNCQGSLDKCDACINHQLLHQLLRMVVHELAYHKSSAPARCAARATYTAARFGLQAIWSRCSSWWHLCRSALSAGLAQHCRIFAAGAAGHTLNP